jgi:hypothetical protein
MDKLTSKNWVMWSLQMASLLEDLNLWEVIMNRSPEDRPRLKAKVVQDQQEQWELDWTAKDHKACQSVKAKHHQTSI